MHFWASDLLCFLIAFCLYALFLIPPGAVLAYYFRVRLAAGSPRDNIAAALVLSAICLPPRLFLAGHFFSNAGVWMLMGTFWLAFAATFSRLKLAVSPKVIAGAIVVALLCYFSLADLPAKQ